MKKLLTLIAAAVAVYPWPASARQLVWVDLNPSATSHYNVYERDGFQIGNAWEFVASVSVPSFDVAFDASQKFYTVTTVGWDGTEVPLLTNAQPQTGTSITHTFTKILTPRMRS